MKQFDADRLAQLAVRALERTAFVLADPVDSEAATELPAVTRAARIAYSGPTCGEFFLAASEGFLRELASSMLGVEPQEVDPDNQGQDALKEPANLVGGSGILELGDDDRLHSLSLPVLCRPDEIPAVDSGRQCFLDSDGELLQVVWAPQAAA